MNVLDILTVDQVLASDSNIVSDIKRKVGNLLVRVVRVNRV